MKNLNLRRFKKHLASVFLLTAAAILFQNCGQGFKSIEFKSSSSTLGSPTPNPNITPTVTPTPTMAPTATPVMSPVPTPIFSPHPLPSSAPPWLNNIAPGTWQAVSLNTIDSVDPADDPNVNPNHPNRPAWRGNSGQSAVLNAWNGGAFAPAYGKYGSLIVWGGGHQDYYGNEIYAFDLETLRWNRVTNPYPRPSFTAARPDYPDGHYSDGTPVPPHTYDQLEYHPGTNSFITLRSMADNEPINLGVPYLFSFDTKTWRRGSRNSSNHYASGGWSVYDSSRDLFWAEGGSGTNAFSSFDPKIQNSDGTFGRWTNYPYKIASTDAVASRDPVRDLILVTAFREGPNIYSIDLKQPQAAEVRVTHGGTPPSFENAHGWEWSHTRGAFIYWSGETVHELKPSGQTWTWTNITSAANTVTPDYDSGGVYGRFRLMRYQDVELAITVNNTTKATYVFRLP